jgi:hypothetical protein
LEGGEVEAAELVLLLASEGSLELLDGLSVGIVVVIGTGGAKGKLDGSSVTGRTEGDHVTGTLDGILDVGVTEGIKVGEIDGYNGERVVGTADGCCVLGIPVGVYVAEYAGIADDGSGDGNSVGAAELLSDGM